MGHWRLMTYLQELEILPSGKVYWEEEEEKSQ